MVAHEHPKICEGSLKWECGGIRLLINANVVPYTCEGHGTLPGTNRFMRRGMKGDLASTGGRSGGINCLDEAAVRSRRLSYSMPFVAELQ